MIIQKSTTMILFLLLCVTANANIWDNIFSQTEGGVPLRFSKSFSGQYKNETNDVSYYFDYNHDLELLTIKITQQSLIVIPIATLQLQLQTMVWSLFYLTQCHRYLVQFLPNNKNLKKEDDLYEKFKNENFPTSSKQTFISSASNLLFKYIGKHQDLYLYEFQYDLFDKKPTINGQEFPHPVIALGKDGVIVKAYKDKTLKQQIPIELKSNISKPRQCKSKVESITINQLQDLVKNLGKMKAPGDFKLPF